MIYLFRTHRVNFSNFFLAILYHSQKSQILGPCQYSINDIGLLDLIVGDLCKTFVDHPDKFRTIDWQTSIDKLKILHSTSEKHLVFGSHLPNQIEYLKTQFDKELITISLNYDCEAYPQMIANMAKNHVYMLQTQKITPTEHDINLMSTLSSNELIDYYIKSFDQMSLIPKSITDIFEYNIDIEDFLEKDKIKLHFDHLGFEFNQQASDYYDKWISLQQVLN